MSKPAYVVVRVVVKDPAAYEAYKAAAQESIAAAGGRYLVRGGETSLLEGDAKDPRRLVVLEFPDRATAEAWYHGDAYRHARSLREGIAEMQAELVEGA
ncbi:MAG: DUF1330 domain-containing protein [Paracoccaceae bacterium]